MEFRISGNELKTFVKLIMDHANINDELIIQALPAQLKLQVLQESIRFKSSDIDFYALSGPKSRFTLPLKEFYYWLNGHISHINGINVEFPDNDANELVKWTFEDSVRKKTYWITYNIKTDTIGAGSIGAGSIGARGKQKNKTKQLKEQADLKKAKASSSKTSNVPEPTFKELLGIVLSLARDHSSDDGLVIGEVLNQGEEDICWAIVLTRLLQAIYNKGKPQTMHLKFSYKELVGHIKPNAMQPNGPESSALSNLNLAFKYIREKGILKESVGTRTQSVGAKGNRIPKSFARKKDVNAAYVREKLDQYPVGLIIEIKSAFSCYTVGKGIYHLPNINRKGPMHSILLIGYGRTDEGEDYFIGQNSHGVEWGYKGYIQLTIMDKCDIICLNE